MEAALQVLVSGLLTGMGYALAAIGMTLILGIGRVLNLAHGGFFALGAYAAFQTTVWGLPAVVGAAPAAAAGVVLGAAVERAAVRPIRTYPLAAAIVLLGVAILAEEGFRLVWGSTYRSVPLRLPPLLIGQVVVSTEQIGGAAIAAVALGALALFLRSRPGLALRAAAADPEIATLSGIDVGRLQTATFGVACGMAAGAGAFLSPLLTVSPTMGRVPLIISIAMVVLGGAGRVWGTLIASLVIGLLSTAVAFYFAAAWSYIFTLLVIIGILVWRRDGALGRAER